MVISLEPTRGHVNATYLDGSDHCRDAHRQPPSLTCTSRRVSPAFDGAGAPRWATVPLCRT
jgi:hypothetical protein